MSIYGFFESCLETTRAKYKELCDKPKARAAQYDKQVKEILNQIHTAWKYNEITEKEAIYLTNEFRNIDFTKISEYRKKK